MTRSVYYLYLADAVSRAVTWMHRNTIGRIVAAGIARWRAEQTAEYIAALGAAERRRVVRGLKRRAE